MSCRIIQKVCKTAGETKRYGFDFVRDPETGELGFLARGWRPGQIYQANDVVLPSRRSTGLQYSASGGQSGFREPAWPTVAGGTVTDGTITWTAEAIDNDSVRTTISSSAWSADSALTVSDEQLDNTNGVQRVSALVAGGTEGEVYEVTNTATMADGAIEQSIIEVHVE